MRLELTSHSHRSNAVKGLLGCRDFIVVMFMGKSELIQDEQFAPGILDGLKSRH